ncbi:DNA polymerase III subunit chi [Rhizobiales bacterium]|uniref:DNA polymerase III subunit chi n=1 Tax=Hongsoonwoonella zoysiae TaxID=2821844 RepID=UPI0015600B92|nr:DNA polymerase III subunit chi [Hongsoonwoonella zoysiae]NRG18936.1 DNA polymerase III subunit chi [Hongsoonwoonella zoysiae]
MTEVLFYHLTLRPLEDVLPGLLEKCLEREWRVVVQTGSDERVGALDSLLWTYRDDSFLPHGAAGDGNGAEHPVFLTSGPDNPNAANVRFLVDRASPPDLAPYMRAVFVFDGHDPDALNDARAHWKSAKDAGHDITYWQQTERGGWEQKA